MELQAKLTTLWTCLNCLKDNTREEIYKSKKNFNLGILACEHCGSLDAVKLQRFLMVYIGDDEL